MEKLVQLAREALDAGEACVLCTVVRLDGSGYGQPGSRLLLTESGQRCGYISGGCLEKDLCRRVWSATQHGPKLLAFDTRGQSVSAARYNTGCEGVVYVVCRRITSDQTLAIDVLDCSAEVSANVRLLTVYQSGSPRFHVGDMWIEMADNRFESPDAAALPSEVEQLWLGAKRNRPIRFRDGPEIVDAAIEILPPPRSLIVFGAGDDAIPVVRSAADLGWHVTVVGKRPELASHSRFASLSDAGKIEIRCGDPATVAKELLILPRTDLVVMTHDFESDVRLMPVLLESPSRFIGLLGPKRRLGSLVKRLYESGRAISEDEISRLRSPVGLDIGAVNPEEIAVSIIAELIAVEHQRSGTPLHHRQRPLHEPAPPIDVSSDPSISLS